MSRYFTGSRCNQSWEQLESYTARYLRGKGWSTFRRLLLSSRGLRCESCKEGFAASKLDIHHIKKIRLARHLRFEESNCIICCKKCHSMLEWLGEQVESLGSGPKTLDPGLQTQEDLLSDNILCLAKVKPP